MGTDWQLRRWISQITMQIQLYISIIYIELTFTNGWLLMQFYWGTIINAFV